MPCPRTLHQDRRLLEWFKGTAAEHHMSTYTLMLYSQRQQFTTFMDQKCCGFDGWNAPSAGKKWHNDISTSITDAGKR